MPETAIHEHRQPPAPEHEIRLAEHPLPPPPPREPVPPEKDNEDKFCGAVAGAADAGHSFRTLRFSEEVYHQQINRI